MALQVLLPPAGNGQQAVTPLPMQIVGPDRAREKLTRSKSFNGALSRLLTEAGLARVAAQSPIHVRACTLSRGNSHTKGLTIKSPDTSSVQLTWHEGGNEECILFRITTPRGLAGVATIMDFHNSLMSAATRSNQQLSSGSSKATPAAGAPAAPGPGLPEQHAKLADAKIDGDTAELLLLELASMKGFSSDWLVPRRKVMETLIAKPFEITPVGPVFDWLVANGFFSEPDKKPDFFELCESHREKCRPPAQSAEATPAPPAAVGNPAAAPASPPAAPAFTRERFQYLMGRAAEVEALRTKLAALDKKRAPVQEKFDRYKGKLDEIDADRKVITDQLDTPEMKQLAAELSAIEQALGIAK